MSWSLNKTIETNIWNNFHSIFDFCKQSTKIFFLFVPTQTFWSLLAIVHCHLLLNPLLYNDEKWYKSKSRVFIKFALEVLCKKDVLQNLTKFAGKHVCQSLHFHKVVGLVDTSYDRGTCVNFLKIFRSKTLDNATNLFKDNNGDVKVRPLKSIWNSTIFKEVVYYQWMS